MLLALTSSAFAQDFKMTFSDVEIEAGKTAELNVTFESKVTIAGWQMFLYLPEGIELSYDEDVEEYEIVLSDSHHKKHACEVTKTADGAMMLVMSGGTKTYEMKENSGDLCTIVLKAADTFQGKAKVDVKNIRISDKSGTAYSQDDSSFEISVKEVIPEPEPVVIDNGSYLLDEEKGAEIGGIEDKTVAQLVIPATVENGGKTYEVTSIADNAFKDNEALAEVSIPKSVKRIGANAFANCKNLTKVMMDECTDVVELAEGAFDGVNDSFAIFVPDDKVNEYKAAAGWSKYADHIFSIKDVRVLDVRATSANTVVYDLNGRKMQSPSKKGVFVVDGRKVIK